MPELHEDFAREHGVKLPSNRRFGLVVGAIAFLFGCIRAALHAELGPFSAILIAAGSALMIAGLLRPDLLAPLNRGWTKLGLLLHKITNPVFLGAMYFVAVVPTGLAMRLFGVDPMGARSTSWIRRMRARSSVESLKKPF